MIKYKILAILLLLLSCKPQTKGFDSTAYDLYKESQFANGFALIKDDYGKRMVPHNDQNNYADGITHASVMFGEMDMLNIKKQVIAQMDNPKSASDDEGIWRPLYDGVRQSHGHEYEPLYGWVYWLIFNPQADKSLIGVENDPLIDISILTAMSRAKVDYWHNKIFTCMKNKLPQEELAAYKTSWIKVSDECQKEYVEIITQISKEIYLQLKKLPQYKRKD